MDDYLDDNGRVDDMGGMVDDLLSLHPLDLAQIHERLTDKLFGDGEAARLCAKERADWLLDGENDD